MLAFTTGTDTGAARTRGHRAEPPIASIPHASTEPCKDATSCDGPSKTLCVDEISRDQPARDLHGRPSSANSLVSNVKPTFTADRPSTIAAMDSDDEDELYTLVTNKKPSGPKIDIFVGNLKAGITSDELEHFVLERAGESEVRVKIYKVKLFDKTTHVNARLTINKVSESLLTSTTFWPRSLYGRRWDYNFEQHQAKIKGSSSGNTTSANDDLQRSNASTGDLPPSKKRARESPLQPESGGASHVPATGDRQDLLQTPSAIQKCGDPDRPAWASWTMPRPDQIDPSSKAATTPDGKFHTCWNCPTDDQLGEPPASSS